MNSPLETWRQDNFGTISDSGDAADDADPDGDEVTNINEYTAGTDPNSSTDFLKLSTVTKTGSTFFRRMRRKGRADLHPPAQHRPGRCMGRPHLPGPPWSAMGLSHLPIPLPQPDQRSTGSRFHAVGLLANSVIDPCSLPYSSRHSAQSSCLHCCWRSIPRNGFSTVVPTTSSATTSEGCCPAT